MEPLHVPVQGVHSDGEETIGSAVALVFSLDHASTLSVPFLKDALESFYETDRLAKTILKKRLRGVRPIERVMEEQSTPRNDAIRDYCLSVRASLTKDG